jgi:hypothetical protein
MFYIRSGAVHDNGTGNVFLAPLPQGHPYQGLTFFQAPGNTNPSSFNGATSYRGFGNAVGIGTLYFPDATLELGGTGDMYVNGIIADKVLVYGSGLKQVGVPEPSAVSLLVVACAGLLRRRPGTRR